MKVCIKCQAEYPDDMAFCSYCGTPLQSKIEERVCPSCGKTVHADNLRFCPYCAYNFTTLQANTSSNPKSPLPSAANIKQNSVKIQSLSHEEKSVSKHLTSDEPNNVCPSCNRVIYAQNIKSCPYCGEKIDFSQNSNSTLDVKSKVNDNNPSVQGNVCPTCGKSIHAEHLHTCPYCGSSLKLDNKNPQTPPSNVHKPLSSDVNVKKTFNAENKTVNNEHSTTVMNEPVTDNSSGSETDSKSSGGFLKFFICCVVALVINGLIYSLLINAICSCAVLYTGWTLIKDYYRSNRIFALIATILVIIITIGGLGIFKSVGKQSVRKRVDLQPSVLIVNDLAYLK